MRARISPRIFAECLTSWSLAWPDRTVALRGAAGEHLVAYERAARTGSVGDHPTG
jgi:hypothetical protein